MRRRNVLLLTLAAAAAAAAVLYRRRAGTSDERADLYLGDGSLISLSGDEPDARRLLALGREVLDLVPVG